MAGDQTKRGRFNQLDVNKRSRQIAGDLIAAKLKT